MTREEVIRSRCTYFKLEQGLELYAVSAQLLTSEGWEYGSALALFEYLMLLCGGRVGGALGHEAVSLLVQGMSKVRCVDAALGRQRSPITRVGKLRGGGCVRFTLGLLL